MKNLLYFLIFTLFLSSCSIKEKPVFIKVDDVQVVGVSADTIRLKAFAYFKNPNSIGGAIAVDKMTITVNDEEVANMFTEVFDVPAKKTFQVPLQAAIPTRKLLQSDKNGLLDGLIKSFLKRSVKVRMKGNLKYKVFGFSDTYLIDKTEEIKF